MDLAPLVATVADVFISYSKKQRALTERIAALLEHQQIERPDSSREPLTVWWDRSLRSGDVFYREITQEIDAARAVVVVWSEGAIASDWVYAEAQRAASQRKLVPLRDPFLDRRKIPLPYSALHIDDADNEAAIITSVMARLGGRRSEDIRGLGFEQSWLLDPKAEAPLDRLARVSPALLLQAKYRLAPFIDVDGQLPGLIDWAQGRDAQQPQKTAGRVIHGPGGLGKTRLLIEVVSELSNRGWLAGFLNRAVLDHATRGPQLESLVRDGRDAKGLLVVVDYAESRSDEVTALSRLMVERERAGGAPARLVLLSRSAGDWWRDLSRRDPNVALVFGIGEETMDTTRLAGIPSGDARVRIWRDSAAAFKAHLAAAEYSEVRDLDPTAPPTPPLAARLNAIEHDPDYTRPLAIQMEAMLWLRGSTPGAGERGIAPMLDRMVSLERDHWKKVTEGVSEIGLDRGVAQVTAVQGVEGRDQAMALLNADSTYFGARTMETTAAIVRELSKLYGEQLGSGDTTRRSRAEDMCEELGALEPDLVGEHHLASMQDLAPLIDACLVWAGDDAQKRRSILTVLNRATRPEHGAKAERACELLDHLVRDRLRPLAADMAAVMVETPGALAQRLDRQVGTFDEEALAVLDTALPQQSLALMDLSLHVAQRRFGLAHELVAANDREGITRSKRDTQEVLPHLADRLNTLGNRLYDVGRREEALAATQEAVDVIRRLAKTRPDTFLPDLAMSLGNLGNRLSGLGRREEALAATLEAGNIIRRLAETQPDTFLPDLASSLNNLGNDLSGLGRREEALAATQEAVNIRRRLAETRPDVFLHGLAMSLNNLGNRLADLGRREEALAATQKAVDIYRRLAETRPDAFLPDLALSLNNLGNRLADLGRREEALAATQKAVDIRRRLAESRPDSFLPGLASNLNNLGNRLSGLGHREEALAATQEAVDIRRRLAETRPDAFLPDLAMSLNNLGTNLSDLSRREEALAATQEAVDIIRRLAETRPDTFLPDLALSLNNLGNRLSGLGRREEALAATREAVDIRRRLAKTRPDTFLPGLATSLNNLGNRLSGLGRREEALAATQEAVDIRRRLAETRPDAFLPDLASSLNNLGNRLSGLDRREEALAATQEAIDIYRRLAETRPDAFLPDLALSLNNLGNRLADLGRREEALTATQEAVDIRRRLAETRPDSFLPDFASNLNNLGNDLSGLGRGEEALAATQEAVGIYRRLAETRPDTFLLDLVRSLGTLGRVLAVAERHADATAVTHEGLMLIVPFVEKHARAGDLVHALAQDYLAACKNAGVQPDRALLERVERALNKR